MAYYYQYNFVSPEIVYSTVKEELKSYFDTGAIDDLMFPTYVDKCLRKLGKSSYPISEKILDVENYEARLPDNFYGVREAWMCVEIKSIPYQSANSFYSQTSDPTTILISSLTTNANCANPDCTNSNCNGGCVPELIQATYKTNRTLNKTYKRQYLLKPGIISNHKDCQVGYTGEWDAYNNQGINQFAPGDASFDTFNIRGNKFVTSFKDATIHLVFYSTDFDSVGNQLIPDNYRVREYIEAFLKYKMFELLTNQTNDETFQQLQQKLVYYKQLSEEAFILANAEIMKQTVYQKQRKIKETLNRFNMYELPYKVARYGRRRNN